MSEFNANQLNPDNINGGKKFNKGDGFSASDLNSVVEGILYSETQGGGNVDLTDYQKKTDEGLLTTDKTIVGAINEVNEKVGQGGSSIEVDAELSNTSENPVQNKVITEALDTKLDKFEPAYKNSAVVWYVKKNTDGSLFSATKGISGSIKADVIPITGKGGTLRIGTPTAPEHATTKKYVDDLVASVGGYVHNIAFCTQGNGEMPTTILQKLTGTSKISTAFTYVENKGICLGAFNSDDHPHIVEFGPSRTHILKNLCRLHKQILKKVYYAVILQDVLGVAALL